jgi:hypothetical protein
MIYPTLQPHYHARAESSNTPAPSSSPATTPTHPTTPSDPSAAADTASATWHSPPPPTAHAPAPAATPRCTRVTYTRAPAAANAAPCHPPTAKVILVELAGARPQDADHVHEEDVAAEGFGEATTASSHSRARGARAGRLCVGCT